VTAKITSQVAFARQRRTAIPREEGIRHRRGAGAGRGREERTMPPGRALRVVL